MNEPQQLDGSLESGAVKPEQQFALPQQDFVEQQLAATEQEQAMEISGAEKEAAYKNILSKIGNEANSSDPAQVAADAQLAAAQANAESQVQMLVDVALNKGVLHAVKVARHLEDNYVLDGFHDKLLGEELHRALVSKGLIGEV